MPRERWAVPCSARRSNGEPCAAYSITGGFVCISHGGGARQVREAAARRWGRERLISRFERKMAREGCPLDPFLSAYIRYRFSADSATWRRHRRTRPVAGVGAAILPGGDSGE
jgi:hypothetical protein